MLELNRIILNQIHSDINNLVAVFFSYNDYTFIRGNTFHGLKQLGELNLSRNKLEGVETELLEGLDNLITIDFSYNAITFIDFKFLPFLSNSSRNSLIKVSYLCAVS